MKPTQHLERLFGPDWPDVLDDLEERPVIKIVYKQEAEVIGLSYRHDTVCLYIGTEGKTGTERKTIPLSEIDAVEWT